MSDKHSFYKHCVEQPEYAKVVKERDRYKLALEEIMMGSLLWKFDVHTACKKALSEQGEKDDI